MVHLNEMQQKSLNANIGKYLRSISDNVHIVCDLETNGLNAETDSVLSISAQKIRINPDKSTSLIASYNRYYYPCEPYNPHAIKVNGLTEEQITKLRGANKYDYYFVNDTYDFMEFCLGCHNFIGHNLEDFDMQWLENCIQVDVIFDTMKNNRWMPDHTGIGPRLVKAIEYLQLPYETDKLHGSAYDVAMTRALFEQMLQLSTVRMKVYTN